MLREVNLLDILEVSGYDIPVIFLFSQNRDIDIDKGFESGADD